ncbi:MAG: CoA transferase [Myxococcota bacterium]|nr:CoA transferase [Myxococcota bacterium]
MERGGPLAGVTVVDLTRVLAGPYATLLLADLGARVIKVERPDGGDDARRIGPFVDGRSAYFLSVNRGKESIALDLGEARDRALFERLLERADVLAENFRPGALARRGYGWEALHARWPRLVLASTSGFGQTGPLASRPAYDLVVQAMGGIMSLTGHAGGPPTRVGTSIGDLAAGLFTALGVVAALHERERTGVGSHVDVAMLDSQVALLENAFARLAATGRVPGPLGSRHPSIAPFQAYAARDGHLVIAAGNDALFRRLCARLGRPALADDPRFASNDARVAHVEALQAEIEAALAADDVARWLARLEEEGIPCGPLRDVAQVAADPQVAARHMLVEVDDGAGGRMRVPGNPIKSATIPDPTRRPGAPELDGDRGRILAWLDAEPGSGR